jgi:hypothetical protein
MVARKVPEHQKFRYAILKKVVKSVFRETYVPMRTGYNYIAVMSLGTRQQQSVKLVSFELLGEKLLVKIDPDPQIETPAQKWEEDLANPDLFDVISNNIGSFYRDTIRKRIKKLRGRNKENLKFRYFILNRTFGSHPEW